MYRNIIIALFLVVITGCGKAQSITDNVLPATEFSKNSIKPKTHS
jgi:hypothetical protein